MRPPPSLIQTQRDLGLRGSLFWFVRAAWPVIHPSTPLAGLRLVEEVCRHLEAVSAGQCKRLKIHVPPGHSKSSLVGVLWPVWEWLRVPYLRVYGVSYDQGLSGRDARAARRLVDSPWFRERWPELRVHGAGEEKYETSQGGLRVSTSVGGALTGHHMERLLIDDPTKPLNVTEVGLAAATRWWRETVVGRINPHLAIVLVMQRLHEGDLSGYLDGPEWTELRLPARFDPAEACRTPFGGDWRTAPGDVLAPDLQDADTLDEKARGMGPYAASAQLQQRPASASGLIFRREWFRRTVTLPDRMRRVISADLSFKGSADADRVAIQVWGWSGAEYHLLEESAQPLSFTETLAALRAVSKRHPPGTPMLIEDKANGPAAIDSLRAEIPGVIPWAVRDDKRARAHAVTAPWAAGQVFLCEGTEAFEAELASFPVAKHDDRVDAMTQAFAYMLEAGRGYNLGAWESVDLSALGF